MGKFIIQTPKGKKIIGPGEPVFIVAEMSGNHNQSYRRALQIIDKAIEAGVDAIKLQTYTPDTLTLKSDKKWFKISRGPWAGQTLYDLYKTAYTPWEWQPKLKKYVEGKGLVLFSSPFDPTAVDFLEKIDVSLYKVASFEVVDIPLLEKIGKTRKPVIMSRGMATEQEIELAIKTLKSNGAPEVALLHCVSSYPAKPEEMNLLTIPDMSDRFQVVSGLSDHTLGTTVVIASVALGASIVEKHFTLCRADGGPDAQFSLEPQELCQMVTAIREVEVSLGKAQYGAGTGEAMNIVYRKSLFVAEDIKKDEILSEKNVRSIRPGFGLEPKLYKDILGKRANTNIKKGTPLSWDLIRK